MDSAILLSVVDFDLVSRLGATERLVAWAQAEQLAGIRELARRRPELDPDAPPHTLRGDGVCQYAHLEIAAALVHSAP